MTARLGLLATLAIGIVMVFRPIPTEPPPAIMVDVPRLRWAEVAIEAPPPPATEEFRALGERLYGWNCMPCHGAEGKGDGPAGERLGLRPRDYTRGTFKLRTSGEGELPFDEDLYRTITAGVPASKMPSFVLFEPADRWALVAHVKSLTRSILEDGTEVRHFERRPPLTKIELPPRPARPDLSRGARLFRAGARCAVCHGDQGHGDGPAAMGLTDALGRPVPVPDLTRGESAFLAGGRPEDIFRILTIGMAGSPMPSFSALPEGDRWDLAFFVASLAGRASE